MTFSKSASSTCLCICFIIVLASCGNNSQTATTLVQPPDTMLSTSSTAAVRFDTLERFFQNDNWLLVAGTDSSYLYCSRTGNTTFTSTSYKMVKGDSVNIMITGMQHSGDTVYWRVPPDTTIVRLENRASGKLVWTNKDGLHQYIFEKTDSSHISLTYPGSKKALLVKISPLSSFLVRSKYDYLHGTRLAFQNEK